MLVLKPFTEDQGWSMVQKSHLLGYLREVRLAALRLEQSAVMGLAGSAARKLLPQYGAREVTPFDQARFFLGLAAPAVRPVSHRTPRHILYLSNVTHCKAGTGSSRPMPSLVAAARFDSRPASALEVSPFPALLR